MSIPDSGAAAEAADALVVLGYSRTQALNAISKTDCAGRSVEEIIKYALKLIAQ
ncbi:hypothetical protein SDC9_129364 [bioreactor metagenome]|uniref:Holliday junction DNA helicase RuvA C-terminal domain-containing protein n=1 Tax=bioreactor metagenome TaxID=1076179 RepID=A0A645CZL2_9ZZZZ